MIKLIMSDMDGTLLDENGQLPAGSLPCRLRQQTTKTRSSGV